jgi:hypothetical protein
VHRAIELGPWIVPTPEHPGLLPARRVDEFDTSGLVRLRRRDGASSALPAQRRRRAFARNSSATEYGYGPVRGREPLTTLRQRALGSASTASCISIWSASSTKFTRPRAFCAEVSRHRTLQMRRRRRLLFRPPVRRMVPSSNRRSPWRSPSRYPTVTLPSLALLCESGFALRVSCGGRRSTHRCTEAIQP